MKKPFILLSAMFLSLSLWAQEEASYAETINSIEYKSNRAVAMASMGSNHDDFTLITGNAQTVDSVEIVMEGKSKKVPYHLLQYVSVEKQVLVQFMFVNDLLYSKNISHYFKPGDIKNAEEKYKALNDWIVNSNKAKMLMSPGSDEVYFVDDQIAAGKIRKYPAKRIHYNVWEGVSGIILDIPDPYKLEDVHQSKGIWVFITVVNTFDLPISTKFNFPKPNPPYATINELAGVDTEEK